MYFPVKLTYTPPHTESTVWLGFNVYHLVQQQLILESTYATSAQKNYFPCIEEIKTVFEKLYILDKHMP